jgi:hypothetical protein
MEEIDSYLTIARASGREGFLKQFDHPFLLRKPVDRKPISESTLSPGHRTNAAKIDPAELDAMAELDRPPSWRVAKVKKPSGKLSIGRLSSCDIYISLPSVSKQHATLVMQAGRPGTLTDDGSTNGTFVNGDPLPPAKPHDVKLGDVLRFGGVEVELLSAGDFYDRLIAGLC